MSAPKCPKIKFDPSFDAPGSGLSSARRINIVRHTLEAMATFFLKIRSKRTFQSQSELPKSEILVWLLRNTPGKIARLWLRNSKIIKNEFTNSKIKVARNGRGKVMTSPQRPHGLPKTPQNTNRAIYRRLLHCRWR